MNRDSKMFVKLINLDFFLDEHTFYAYMNIVKHRFRMEFILYIGLNRLLQLLFIPIAFTWNSLKLALELDPF